MAKIEDELKALETVLLALLPLSSAARERILEYVQHQVAHAPYNEEVADGES